MSTPNLGVNTSLKRQLSDGNADGTVLGQSATDLIAFYGGSPVAQRAANNLAAITTTAATTTTPYGYSTSTQANAIVSALNEIIATLVGLGISVH